MLQADDTVFLPPSLLEFTKMASLAVVGSWLVLYIENKINADFQLSFLPAPVSRSRIYLRR